MFPTFLSIVSFYLVLLPRSNEQPTNELSLFPSIIAAPYYSLERPMKIEIVVDPTRPVPLASRVAPAPAANGAQTQPARLVYQPKLAFTRLIFLNFVI